MQHDPRGLVVDDLDLRLVVPGEPGLPLAATLRYSDTDPYAVLATFRADDTEISWVLARDLLAEGLVRASGEGDVHVWPAWEEGREVVMISLSSPDGQAVLEADATTLRVFLERTFVTVPPGTEGQHLDIDAVLSSLLA